MVVASGDFHRLECWCQLMIMTAGGVTPGRGVGGIGWVLPAGLLVPFDDHDRRGCNPGLRCGDAGIVGRPYVADGRCRIETGEAEWIDCLPERNSAVGVGGLGWLLRPGIYLVPLDIHDS